MHTDGYRWNGILRDLRVALRLLVRNRTYAAAMLATMAIVIGLNGAVFGCAYAILLRPLPYPDHDRLVELMSMRQRPTVAYSRFFSAPGLDDIAAEIEAFDGVARSIPLAVTVVKEPEPTTGTGLQISGDWFRVFGIVPEAGRGILPSDADAGEQVAVISHRMWEREFGSNPAVLGTKIWLSTQPITILLPFAPTPKAYSIVGILSAGQPAPDGEDVLIPLPSARVHTMGASPRAIRTANAVARVKAGSTVRAAQDQLRALGIRLAATYPDTDGGRELQAIRLLDALTIGYRESLLMLLGAVTFVVLLACVSLASLLLARNSSRQQEVAVRACLGATRARLIQQFVTESLLLSAGGAAAGLWVASWAMRLIRAFAPREIPRLDQIRIDTPMLLYTAGTAVACGLVIGCIPAFQITRRTDLNLRTREGSDAAAASHPIHVRGLLIGCQITLAFPLLVGALLTVRSVTRLTHVDLGFSPEHVTAMSLKLSAASCSKFAACTGVIQDLLQRIESVPGVASAAVGSARPLGVPMGLALRPEGAGDSTQRSPIPGESAMVTADYFDVLKIPLSAGRGFDAAIDTRTGPAVAILNETAARSFFAGDALHKRLTNAAGTATIEVVGVVADTRESRLVTAPPARVYLPLDQAAYVPRTTLLVRTAEGHAGTLAAVRQRVLDVDKQASISDTAAVDEIIAERLAAPRFNAALLSTFAVVSVLLSLVGTFGLISYTVSQRTREFGIRLAVGARPRQILWLVVRDGLWTLGWSLTFGAGAALLLSSALRTLLFEVTATDPFTYAIVAVLVTAIGLAGYYLPSRRAMRLEPLSVLRE